MQYLLQVEELLDSVSQSNFWTQKWIRHTQSNWVIPWPIFMVVSKLTQTARKFDNIRNDETSTLWLLVDSW
jgi:hypothetical protein